MEFTYEAYKKLVNISLENGYEICSYDSIDDYDKCIVFRHDIDFSPSKALELAKIEQMLGVKSTYFVLLSTDFYNVFSSVTSKVFNQILDMGHHIGLHFDEQRYVANSIEQMKDHVYYESLILGKALNTKIDVISMHRPSKFSLDASIEFDGLINSYNNKYFRDIKYISDSRMEWREDPMRIISSKKYNKIHILTHPFWYSIEQENIKSKLFNFLNEASSCRYESLNKNFRNIQEFITRGDLL